MIPKTIHYCWFGGNPKSKLVEKCIKSWKKYCPDYEIIEWNEKNFDINCFDYVKEAYEAQKWAFVTDYVRIWALNTYGGVYLDTDVEIKKIWTNFCAILLLQALKEKRCRLLQFMVPNRIIHSAKQYSLTMRTGISFCLTVISTRQQKPFLLPLYCLRNIILFSTMKLKFFLMDL